MVKLFVVLALAGCQLAPGGDKNRCETQMDCLDGYVCTAAGTCERPMMSCTPVTCDGQCGMVDDHCGGTLACGACPDHCTNDAQDPSETDVDCGGDCQPCATGLHCAITSDCATGTCDGDTCRTGTWSTVAPMPTPRTELAAVAGTDGRIYVIGGAGASGAGRVVEIYDPVGDSWTTGAPMPTSRSDLAVVLGDDGKIYAIGGDYASVSDPGASIVAQAYDPALNTWESLPPMPIGREALAAAVDASGTIYAIGGYDGSTAHELGSVATFHPGDASWTTLPDPMTTARSDHAAAALPDGRIYALGGEGQLAGDELAALEYYQPGMTGWHTAPPMPTTRKMLAAAVIGPQLYALGGNRWVGSHMSYTRVVEVYDTTTHAWSQVTSMPSGRYGHAAVALGGKIYVVGGVREAEDTPTSIVEVFTP
jgi:N-acetylneuraminic acid mutarotase